MGKKGAANPDKAGTTGGVPSLVSAPSHGASVLAAPYSSSSLLKFLISVFFHGSDCREIICFLCGNTFPSISFRLIFELNEYFYILRQGKWKPVIYFHYITLCAFHHEPYYYTHRKMNNLMYFFLSSQSRVFFRSFDHFHHSLRKPLLSRNNTLFQMR